jgi:hypothetical protein
VPLLLTAFDLADRGLVKLEVGGAPLRQLVDTHANPRLVILATTKQHALICDSNGCAAPIVEPDALAAALRDLSRRRPDASA